MAEKFSFGSEEPIDERNLNNKPQPADDSIAKFREEIERKREEKAEAKRLAEEKRKKKSKEW